MGKILPIFSMILVILFSTRICVFLKKWNDWLNGLEFCLYGSSIRWHLMVVGKLKLQFLKKFEVRNLKLEVG